MDCFLKYYGDQLMIGLVMGITVTVMLIIADFLGLIHLF
jgi:hypothetical protein